MCSSSDPATNCTSRLRAALPRDERPAPLSAGEGSGFPIKPQAPFLGIGAVASQAILGQQRLNFLLKIDVPRRGGRQNRPRVVGTGLRGHESDATSHRQRHTDFRSVVEAMAFGHHACQPMRME